MGKNETYHENQLVELYKIGYIPIKTARHTWGPFLVSSSKDGKHRVAVV
jgi:hypothetical protein